MSQKSKEWISDLPRMEWDTEVVMSSPALEVFKQKPRAIWQRC